VTVVELHRVSQRPRLAVALTFPVYPPLGGGQVRAYNLYRGLAREFDVELITLGPADTAERRTLLAERLWEHRVPKSAKHAALEIELEREAGTAVTDIAMVELYRHTPDYLTALRAAADGATAVVASHPYTFPAIREVTSLPLWYEAHNVEALLKPPVLGSSDVARRLLGVTERVERDCCRDADLVWACSTEDAQELAGRYGVARGRTLVVPNGVALDEVSYVSPSARQAHRRRLRLERRMTATFIASWHGPNVAAARRLLELAEKVPEVDFLIVGSVGTALVGFPVPDNVALTGTVSLGFKQAVLSTATAALNPVTTGSGTNLKMLDYFAAGIPVISTSFGARGLGVRPGEHYLAADPAEFAAALLTCRESGPDSLEPIVRAARTLVETHMSWDVISSELLRQLLARRLVSRSA
jgi:glycosyltransferase involved in cell wall biosynthesis